MGWRSDHPHAFNGLGRVLVVCIAVVLIGGIAAWASVQNNKINAERAVKEKTIEQQEMAVQETQATERTEERWQWLQSLIPWGEDEAEENINDPNPGRSGTAE